MNKTELIKCLNKWDTDSFTIDDGKQYRKVKSIFYGMGKGIIIQLEGVKYE